MIETSKDILNLTLSFCAIWVTVLLCWLLFYVVATIKKMHDIINFFSSVLKKIDDFVGEIKEKAHGSVAYFKLFGVIAEKVIHYVEKEGFMKKKNNTDNSKKTKTKKAR